MPIKGLDVSYLKLLNAYVGKLLINDKFMIFSMITDRK